MTQQSSSRGEGVLCVGRLYSDFIFTGLERMPALGEEQFATGLSIQVGGGAYITASHLTSLGRPVSLLATLPSGVLALTVRQELLNSGIDIEHCISSDDPKELQLTVALSMERERAFVTKRCGNALPIKKIDWQAHPKIRHLHIGEFTTLIDHPSLINDAHAAGVTVSLDCGWDDGLFKRNDLDGYLRNVDVFLPNTVELEKLSQVCTRIHQLPLCVVKQGDKGATAYHNGKSFEGAAVATIIKDTTGAGDAFNAGFVHAWLSNLEIEQCIALGNRCGSQSVAQLGGAAPY